MLPTWTITPFVVLVLGMAVLPIVLHHTWEKPWFQPLFVLVCAAPLAIWLYRQGLGHDVAQSVGHYLSFITTLGALFVAAGGVFVAGDLVATPRTNVLFLLMGSVLASFIGTTGASMLLVRPLLRTNSQRRHRAHLVPFFILAVANAGGMLTPLGDPPLLVGFISGVPFFWTLKLFPAWVLYVASAAIGLYVADRRAYARESEEVKRRDVAERRPLEARGKRNLLWLGLVIVAAFFPPVVRELGMVGIALASYFGTPRAVHRENGFSFAPILEVAILFIGLFVCLVPIEIELGRLAPELPVREAWQMFWVSGGLSALLDNAPTYAAFAALGRGLAAGQGGLVAGVEPLKLAAISVGCVVWGATTYIGNGPNLMVKAIAERSGFSLPSFARYAVFAFLAMLPAHIVTTLVFMWLER